MVQIIHVSNDHYKLHTFRITSDKHQIVPKNAGKLFDMVLVQLVLRGHVLGLLGHLVQEVASLALNKDFHQHEFLSH